MNSLGQAYPDPNPNPITKCKKPVYVKERAARNPLRCEPTPRTHFQHDQKWVYAVPPGEEFPEKWKNSEDRPLMEQFASLRQGVAEDEAREQGHRDRIKAFQDSQAMFAAQSCRESVRESARSSARSTGRSSARESARPEGATGRLQESGTGRSTSRSDNPFRSARSTGRSEKDLTRFPVSALQTLGHEHPDILAKARAQRAAKYVTTLKNPLEPPSYNSISSRQSFFPAGTNNHGNSQNQTKKSKRKDNARSSGKILVTSRELDTSRMKESLNTLVDELAKTDAQIARQELKIALAPKVKTFDKKSSKK
mmetsp:Transcript_11582/g.18907  ORF Transcript_11582/g.18907 Transcript_11582/m.18907 type:complete len:310 (-) Transcript_11582:117-1046(-)